MKIWNICVSRVVCQFLKYFVSQLSSGSQSSVPVLGGCHWHCAQEWHTVICPYPCGHVLVLLSSASVRQDWKLIRWVFLSPPPPPLSLVPCESHERSCLADAVKFEHFIFTVWILGRLLFLRSCILFSPEWRPSEKRLLVITLVWALVTLRSSFSLIFCSLLLSN